MYKKEVDQSCMSKDDQITNKNEEISFLKNQLYVQHVEVTFEPPCNCEHNKSTQQENKNVENTQVKSLENKLFVLKRKSTINGSYSTLSLTRSESHNGNKKIK